MMPTISDNTEAVSSTRERRHRRQSTIGVAIGVAVSTLDCVFNESTRPADEHIDNLHDIDLSHPITPRKGKKTVRFSDPGPRNPRRLCSTGLTPTLSRTKFFTSTPSLLSKPPKRLPRSKSLPNKLPSEDSSSPIQTLQFAPLRQVLDGRVRRRISRNHLSEEINTITKERKDEIKKIKLEVEVLKQDILEKAQKLTDVERELQDAKRDGQASSDHDAEQTINEDEKTKQLEDEVARLRKEIHSGMNQEHSEETHEEATSMTCGGNGSAPHLFLDDFDTHMNNMCSPSPGPSQTGSADDEQASQLATLRGELSTLSSSHEYLLTTLQRLSAKLRPFIQSPTSTSTSNSDSLDEDNDATTTCSSNSPSADTAVIDTALDNLLSKHTLTQSQLTTLSRAINLLACPSDTSTPQLSSLISSFDDARLVLEQLSPSEHAEGVSPAALLSLLIQRLNSLSARLSTHMNEFDDLKHEHAQVKTMHRSEARRASEADENLQATVREKQLIESQLAELLTEAAESETSLSRLKGALEGYRREVTSLERLVIRLEEEKSRVEGERDDAMTDRRSLREMADERSELMSELETTKTKNKSIMELCRSEARRASKAEEDLRAVVCEKRLVVSRFTELSTQLAERDHGLFRLRDALESHMNEVKGLEKFISRLESDKTWVGGEEGQVVAESKGEKRVISDTDVEGEARDRKRLCFSGRVEVMHGEEGESSFEGGR